MHKQSNVFIFSFQEATSINFYEKAILYLKPKIYFILLVIDIIPFMHVFNTVRFNFTFFHLVLNVECDHATEFHRYIF